MRDSDRHSTQATLPSHWLVVTPYNNLDGGAQVARALVDAARNHGRQASLVDFGWATEVNGKTYRHGILILRSWSAFRALVSAYRAHPRAIVIAIGDASAVFALVVRGILLARHVKVISAQHQPIALSDVVRSAKSFPSAVRALVSWSIRAIHQRAAGLVFLTEAQRQAFLDRNPQVRAPTAVIPNAVRLPICSSHLLRSRVGRMAQGAPVRVLHIGSFSARKNQELAIQALASLGDSTISMTLVGAGQHDEARRLAEGLGVIDRLEIVAQTRDIIEVYDRHDIVLSTALTESFGLTPLEGIVRGLPAVVPANVPFFSELAATVDTVLAFSEYSPTAVANRIMEVARRLREGVVDEATLLSAAIACTETYSSSRFIAGHIDLVEEVTRQYVSPRRGHSSM